MKYVFRFFLDWGSGTILWSANKFTKEKFDYPVNHHLLNLKKDLLTKIDNIIDEYDGSFNPQENNYSEKFNISKENKENLNQKIHSLVIEIQKELGSDYEIIDEFVDI